MKNEKKIRIVVELSKDDYEAFIALKNLLGIQWKELLIAGAVWWADTLDLEQKIDNLRNEIKKLVEQKN